ncbi:S41 family peptidase [Dyadobacter diqingensis]|uniref:S41 family peptidase n=1 Tax=Dyadobacter diqingensis TaxID=2938121 RepID=UPI0020C4770F|nr:S41 family peptidase [Dyadobacter diqingensis]
MNRNLLLPLVVCAAVCLSNISNGQNAGKQSKSLSADCSCSKALDEAIDKVTRIYAGFDDKVTAETKPRYQKLLKKLKSDALSVVSQERCMAILTSYTDFFKDSHVAIIWQGETKQTVLSTDANRSKKDLVVFKQLDKDFIYLKLAAFDQREVGKLDSMLLANKELLAKTPYLIFDLRGNGGGNTSTSDEMAKLIYTNPIIYPVWDYRSSDEHIRSMERYVKSMKDTTASYYQRARKLLGKLKSNPGQMVNTGEDFTRSFDIDPKSYPQHIAFLMDKRSGSSTEFYIFEGKQSKKVTLFGTNSYGVMDYGSDQNFDLCDGIFNLATPWGRNGWVKDFRIDNIGFKPDVRIPANEKDWVAFVQRYYLKQNLSDRQSAKDK